LQDQPSISSGGDIPVRADAPALHDQAGRRDVGQRGGVAPAVPVLGVPSQNDGCHLAILAGVKSSKINVEVLDMTGSIAVLLIILAAVTLFGVVSTVVVVIRDGRKQIPPEKSERPWTAGNLPSMPYSLLRF
jgi:hypothetical protein